MRARSSQTVVAELRERSERDALAPALAPGNGRRLRPDRRAARQAHRPNASMPSATLAARIGSAMHLPPRRCSISNSPAGCTISERSRCGNGAADFEQHPVAGEAFLQSVPSLAHLAPIVRSHRERFDGQGLSRRTSARRDPARVAHHQRRRGFRRSRSPTRRRTKPFFPTTACRKLASRRRNGVRPERRRRYPPAASLSPANESIGLIRPMPSESIRASA